MPSSRRWLRYHYHCEACDGSWLAEGDVVVEADCPFCKTRDVFAYKSDDRVYAERGRAEDAAAVAKKLAATMRKAVGKTVGKPPRAKVRRAG
jgi:hypothetical protein